MSSDKLMMPYRILENGGNGKYWYRTTLATRFFGGQGCEAVWRYKEEGYHHTISRHGVVFDTLQQAMDDLDRCLVENDCKLLTEEEAEKLMVLI